MLSKERVSCMNCQVGPCRVPICTHVGSVWLQTRLMLPARHVIGCMLWQRQTVEPAWEHQDAACGGLTR